MEAQHQQASTASEGSQGEGVTAKVEGRSREQSSVADAHDLTTSTPSGIIDATGELSQVHPHAC